MIGRGDSLPWVLKRALIRAAGALANWLGPFPDLPPLTTGPGDWAAARAQADALAAQAGFGQHGKTAVFQIEFDRLLLRAQRCGNWPIQAG